MPPLLPWAPPLVSPSSKAADLVALEKRGDAVRFRCAWVERVGALAFQEAHRGQTIRRSQMR